jgi:hypothetical protein
MGFNCHRQELVHGLVLFESCPDFENCRLVRNAFSEPGESIGRAGPKRQLRDVKGCKFFAGTSGDAPSVPRKPEPDLSAFGQKESIKIDKGNFAISLQDESD